MKATHCKRGHLRTPETLRPNGTCRECARLVERERRDAARDGPPQAIDPNWFPCGHPRTVENTKRGGSRSCLECHRIKMRIRYRLRRDEMRAYARAYAQANREAARQRLQSWREANAEHAREYGAAARQSRRHGTREDRETRDYVRILRADPCSYCRSPQGGSLDHIVPVSTGGANHWSNYTGACVSCNASKRDRPLLTFLLDRRERLAS